MCLSSLSFDEFVKRFERIFDRPNHSSCASDCLFTLHQGTRLVAEYAVEFGTLAVESEWNKSALQSTFRQGLNGQFHGALVVSVRPKDLNELIDFTIKVDNYQRERSRERVSHSIPPWSLVRHQASLPHVQLRSPSAGPCPLNEEPMQLGRSRLTATERRRHLTSGACLYCGQVGH